tara:strand:- start:354 stop:596 length:243 start_codon:yes stop_codon:yes gene_type:complete
MEEGDKKEHSQAAQIADGFKNLFKSKLGLSSELDEAVFEARREICNSCAEKTDMDNCGLCGCPLATKTRSLITECPAKLW